MKNIFAFTLLFFLVGLTTSTSKVENLSKSTPRIIWSTTPLTWDDFNGKMKKSDPYDAVTLSAVSSSFSGSNNELNFKVEAVFFPKGSKKKQNKQDSKLLKHEQGHFDITEIYARLLRKSLQEKKYKNYKNISKDVDKLYNKNYLAWKKFQNQYDKETDHSKNKLKQDEWNTKIQTQLNELDKFKVTDFKVDVSYLK